MLRLYSSKANLKINLQDGDKTAMSYAQKSGSKDVLERIKYWANVTRNITDSVSVYCIAGIEGGGDSHCRLEADCKV